MCEQCWGDDGLGFEDEEAFTPEQIEAEAERRVANGVAHFNEAAPGWRSLVDVGRLIMSDASRCIAGQVFASYANNPEFLHGTLDYQRPYFDGYDYWYRQFGGSENVAIEYGLMEGEGNTGIFVSYHDLAQAWKAALAAE